MGFRKIMKFKELDSQLDQWEEFVETNEALMSRLWTVFFGTVRCRYPEKFSKPGFQPKMA